jgi:hypothetical protein
LDCFPLALAGEPKLPCSYARRQTGGCAGRKRDKLHEHAGACRMQEPSSGRGGAGLARCSTGGWGGAGLTSDAFSCRRMMRSNDSFPGQFDLMAAQRGGDLSGVLCKFTRGGEWFTCQIYILIGSSSKSLGGLLTHLHIVVVIPTPSASPTSGRSYAASRPSPATRP